MKLIKIATIISLTSCTARTDQGAQAPIRSDSDQTEVATTPVNRVEQTAASGSSEQSEQPENEGPAACLTGGTFTMQLVDPYKFNFDADYKLKEPSLQDLIEEAKEGDLTKDIFKEKNDVFKSVKTEMGYKLNFYFIPTGTEKIRIKWLQNDMIVHTYDVDNSFYETQAFDFENSPIIAVELRGKKEGSQLETILALYYVDLREQT